MALPFTAEQFFDIFAEYNRAFWPAVGLWWVATIAALAAVHRRPERWSPLVSLFLGVLWLWNAVAYHAFLFTRINPAAWLFSGLFAIQAGLLIWSAARHQIVYLSSSGATGVIGLCLAAYSLAYPFLTIALGHRYPATPTFGLPCPTVILTIGLLLTARDRSPRRLAPIPILWGFVGGSAAALLAVPTDYVLLAAGVVLLMETLARKRPLMSSAGV